MTTKKQNLNVGNSYIAAYSHRRKLRHKSGGLWRARITAPSRVQGQRPSLGGRGENPFEALLSCRLFKFKYAFWNNIVFLSPASDSAKCKLSVALPCYIGLCIFHESPCMQTVCFSRIACSCPRSASPNVTWVIHTRKYITYRSAVERRKTEPWQIKYDESWMCGFWDTYADRQIRKFTDKHAPLLPLWVVLCCC